MVMDQLRLKLIISSIMNPNILPFYAADWELLHASLDIIKSAMGATDESPFDEKTLSAYAERIPQISSLRDYFVAMIKAGDGFKVDFVPVMDAAGYLRIVFESCPDRADLAFNAIAVMVEIEKMHAFISRDYQEMMFQRAVEYMQQLVEKPCTGCLRLLCSLDLPVEGIYALLTERLEIWRALDHDGIYYFTNLISRLREPKHINNNELLVFMIQKFSEHYLDQNISYYCLFYLSMANISAQSKIFVGKIIVRVFNEVYADQTVNFELKKYVLLYGLKVVEKVIGALDSSLTKSIVMYVKRALQDFPNNQMITAHGIEILLAINNAEIDSDKTYLNFVLQAIDIFGSSDSYIIRNCLLYLERVSRLKIEDRPGEIDFSLVIHVLLKFLTSKTVPGKWQYNRLNQIEMENLKEALSRTDELMKKDKGAAIAALIGIQDLLNLILIVDEPLLVAKALSMVVYICELKASFERKSDFDIKPFFKNFIHILNRFTNVDDAAFYHEVVSFISYFVKKHGEALLDLSESIISKLSNILLVQGLSGYEELVGCVMSCIYHFDEGSVESYIQGEIEKDISERYFLKTILRILIIDYCEWPASKEFAIYFLSKYAKFDGLYVNLSGTVNLCTGLISKFPEDELIVDRSLFILALQLSSHNVEEFADFQPELKQVLVDVAKDSDLIANQYIILYCLHIVEILNHFDKSHGIPIFIHEFVRRQHQDSSLNFIFEHFLQINQRPINDQSDGEQTLKTLILMIHENIDPSLLSLLTADILSYETNIVKEHYPALVDKVFAILEKERLPTSLNLVSFINALLAKDIDFHLIVANHPKFMSMNEKYSINLISIPDNTPNVNINYDEEPGSVDDNLEGIRNRFNIGQGSDSTPVTSQKASELASLSATLSISSKILALPTA